MTRKSALRIPTAVLAAAALGALAAAGFGCQDPLKDIEKYTVRGYMAADILPLDREVGSWRRAGTEGEARSLSSRSFRESFGDEALSRAKYWSLADSSSATYRLGETGRTVTVEVYDLSKAKGAFDAYSFIREKSLAEADKDAAARAKSAAGPLAPNDIHVVNVPRLGAPVCLTSLPTRTTKVGVQGLLYSYIPFDQGAEERNKKNAPQHTISVPKLEQTTGVTEYVLAFWAERFIVVVAHREPALGADALTNAASAESTLLAFGETIAKKLKQPYDLQEVYALQVPGAVANSERFEPGRSWRRSELTGCVTAKWRGKTGEATLFVCDTGSEGEAESRFESLCRAADGKVTKDFANGLFAGSLPAATPIICFRWHRALVGIVGAAEAEERMAAVEELRRRCAGEPQAPASAPAEPAKAPAPAPTLAPVPAASGEPQ